MAVGGKLSKLTVAEQLAQVMGRMTRIEKSVRNAYMGAAYQEMAKVLRVSLRLVPVDDNILRSSAWLSKPFDLGSKVLVKIGYGTHYAIYVHEILTNYHKPPTQAKYLEQPMRAALPTMAKAIARRAKYLWKTGKTVNFDQAYIPDRNATRVGMTMGSNRRKTNRAKKLTRGVKRSK